jgi:lysophospholipase L1-like esterase
MAVALIAIGAMGPMAIGRGAVPPGTQPLPVPTAAPKVTTVAVLGDSYTGGSAMDSGQRAEWPALLAGRHPTWRVVPFAVGGSGFVAGQQGGEHFALRLDRIVAAQPQVVIVEGGHNDIGLPQAQVQTAAQQVLTLLRAGLPQATIVVLGVLWPGPLPQQMLDLDAALARDAQAVGGTYVDARGWFTAQPSMIGSDGIHPTDAGHAMLADRIGAAVTAAGVSG